MLVVESATEGVKGENTSNARTPPDKVRSTEVEDDIPLDLRPLVRRFFRAGEMWADAAPVLASNCSLNTCACACSCASTAAATAAACFSMASFPILDVGARAELFARLEDDAASDADRFEVRSFLAALLEVVEPEFMALGEVAEPTFAGESAGAMRRERRGARAFFDAFPCSSSSVSASARDGNEDVIGGRVAPEVEVAFFTTPRATRVFPPFWTLDDSDDDSSGIGGTGESTVVVIVVAIYFWGAAAPSYPSGQAPAATKVGGL